MRPRVRSEPNHHIKDMAESAGKFSRQGNPVCITPEENWMTMQLSRSRPEGSLAASSSLQASDVWFHVKGARDSNIDAVELLQEVSPGGSVCDPSTQECPQAALDT